MIRPAEITATLSRARMTAEALMQSTVIIRREGVPVRDPSTGTMTPTLTTVYTGPARLRLASGQPRDVDQAGQRVTEQSPMVWVPVQTWGILVDDVGEIIANPHAPGDVGLVFRIAGIHAQTHSTSRRFPVEVLSYG